MTYAGSVYTADGKDQEGNRKGIVIQSTYLHF